eukprot:1804924-Amphidinium_carterae.1
MERKMYESVCPERRTASAEAGLEGQHETGCPLWQGCCAERKRALIVWSTGCKGQTGGSQSKGWHATIEIVVHALGNPAGKHNLPNEVVGGGPS